MIASTHLVHNSINEMNRAINAANTTLSNSINAFNQLSFNKFVENVIEDHDDDQFLFAPNQTGAQKPVDSYAMDQTTVIGDMKTEDDKLGDALNIAYDQMVDAKETRNKNKQERLEQDTLETQIDAPPKKKAKKSKKVDPQEDRPPIGISKVIKLPYVIGQI